MWVFIVAFQSVIKVGRQDRKENAVEVMSAGDTGYVWPSVEEGVVKESSCAAAMKCLGK